MQNPVSTRLTSLPKRLLTPALMLGAALFMLGGVRVAQAAPEGRSLFPQSLKSMPQEEKTAALTGEAVDAKGTVEFQIALRMRDFAKLQTRVSQGERISQKEMEEKYLPSVADYQATVEWAKAQGLTVLDHDPERLGVRLSGPVAVVERVLATKYAHLTVEGKKYLAAQSVPSLPARVAAPVLGINGLQPYQQMRAHSPTFRDTAPYGIADILEAYNGTKLPSPVDSKAVLTGSKQTIAILINTFPLDSDTTVFWSRNNIKRTGKVDNINVNMIDPKMLPAPTGEETLDVSWAGGIAPGADLRVYAVGSMTLSDMDKGLQNIISDIIGGQVINQLSISVGMPESQVSASQTATDSQYFASLAAKGVSVFVSAGDVGVLEYPSSDPSVTAVGGTTLVINATTHVFGTETVWNDSIATDGTLVATGGGASSRFQKPPYQANVLDYNDTTGVSLPNSNRRLVPDVALAADPKEGAYLVLTKPNAEDPTKPPVQDDKVASGGTSWSAATWAGFSALFNEARTAVKLPPLGLLNPRVYPLLGTTNFRDIDSDPQRAVTKPPTIYPANRARAGYDKATGVGVPVLNKLLTTLLNGGGLTVTEFSPDSGTVGTVVTISGTQLDDVVSVAFNGTSTTDIVTYSGTLITATVPPGATTGPITVTNAVGTTAASPVNFTVLPLNAGSNNNFFAAQVIGPAQTRLTGSNVGANKERGEPNHAGNPGGASIWYRWTPQSNGTYTVNTFGSSFDTLLAVYTGDSVDALTEVTSNDDLASGVTSSVVFDAAVGTTYYIAVDGVRQANGRAAQGTVILNVASANDQPVINDFTPQSGSAGQTVRILGANFLTVTSVTFNGASALFRTDSAAQITAVVPAGATTGRISVTDSANNVATSDAFFTVVPTPDNDLFANSRTLTGTQTTSTGSNVGAFKEAGEPDHADNAGGSSVWFSYTPTSNGAFVLDTFGSNFDTLLAVYTGNNVAALTPVASNDDAGPLGTSSVTFNAVAGTVYRIAVDGFSGAAGNYTLNLRTNTGIPAITAFTPTSGGGGVNVVLTGTGFQTVTSVKFNGTEAPGFQINSDTQITVSVPSGATTGPITATGLNGTGISPTNFTVVALPPNDFFANSQLLLGGAPITVTGSTAGATKEAGEPAIVATDPGGHSIWYSWSPPVSGNYLISTRGSDFDTLLGVFTGSTVANLTPVVANDDDAEGGITSGVTLTATRGVTYRIVVDGADGEAGNVVLSILAAASVQNLYTTNFEPGEGFNSKLPLVGQGGWRSVDGVTGGNAIAVNQFPNLGQQALIGQTPLVNGANALQVYHPLTYSYTDKYPIVNFSTLMQITNSPNGQNDRFAFTGYDDGTIGELFSIIFDNATSEVLYEVDGFQYDTGISFSRDVIYSLQATVDFQNQQYGYGVVTATLNGTPLIAGFQGYFDLSAIQSPKVPTVTRISADWTPADPSAPGDNYMLFDQYTVNTPAAATPSIVQQPASQTITLGQPATFSVTVIGTPPLYYQWYFEGNAIAGAYESTYTIDVVNPSDAGRYYVEVSNILGNRFYTTRSIDAFLVVSTTQVPNTATVEISTQKSPVTESGGKAGVLLLRRTGSLSESLAVSYKARGTAQNGLDYRTLSGVATFKAGSATKRLRVLPLERGIHDGSSVKVSVKLQSGNGYTVGAARKAPVVIQRP